MRASTTAGTSDCEGVMVLHRDGWRQCLDPDCAEPGTPHDLVDLPCTLVLGEDCPHCGPRG